MHMLYSQVSNYQSINQSAKAAEEPGAHTCNFAFNQDHILSTGQVLKKLSGDMHADHVCCLAESRFRSVLN